MIKICSWNINSIRNKVDDVNQFLNKEEPDILFLSETKITQKLESSVEEKIKKEIDLFLYKFFKFPYSSRPYFLLV